jgi:hypothetical protein
LIVNESVTCPFCWETIEITLDTSVSEQEYVEDCFVCCRPLLIRYTAAEGSVTELIVTAESQ